MSDYDIMIFRRPVESPAMILQEEFGRVRIAYGDYWIDFKNGMVRVSDENKPLMLFHPNGAITDCVRKVGYLP